MQFTEEHRAFRAAVRDFVDREINPYVDEWEKLGQFPAHELFPKMAQLDLLGLPYDEKWGGVDAEPVFTAIAGEELGRIHAAGVSMGINVQTNMATPALHTFGSDELREKYLRPAIAGTQVAAIGVSESDAGSDVARLRTRAVRDGDDWVINGSKLFITNGAQADWVCVLVRTSDDPGYRGLSQIIMETSTPGFSVSRKLDKLGNRSSDTAELLFEDVRVPVSNTIGTIGNGFKQQMNQFQHERMIASYNTVGGVELALERTAQYLREREVFGKPLLENQYIQFRLAELHAELDLLRNHNYMCTMQMARGEDISRAATVAKLTAGRLVRKVADTCLQFYGGMGYMEETWTARYFRDTRLRSIGGGADEVMLQILAKQTGLSA